MGTSHHMRHLPSLTDVLTTSVLHKFTIPTVFQPLSMSIALFWFILLKNNSRQGVLKGF